MMLRRCRRHDAATIEIARLVAKSWTDAALRWGSEPMQGRIAAHPLGCVLAALDGERDPAQLGIAPGDPTTAAILHVARARPKDGKR